MTAFVDDNEFPKLLFKEGSAPSSPASGDQALFIDSGDHVLKLKNSGGTVSAVGASYSGARYHQAAGTAQSIPNAAATVVNFDTSDWDTDSAVTVGSSWHYTAPVTGTYQILAMVGFDATVAPASATTYELALKKNGSAAGSLAFLMYGNTAAGNIYTMLAGGDQIALTAGDTLAVTAYQSSGGAQTLVGSIAYNHIVISRVG